MADDIYKEYPALKPIADGVLQQFYAEKTVTIAAGARFEDYVIFNYFRVLSLSGTGLEVIFGNNQYQTPFTGAGIGVKLEYVLPRLTLVNTSGASLTMTYAVAVGDVNDDRLTVSGTLNVTSTTAAPVINVATTGAATTSQVSVTTTATSIVAANSVRGAVTIRNQGATDMFIGSSSGVTTLNGLLVKAGESFSTTTRGAIFGIVGAGSTTVGTWDEAR